VEAVIPSASVKGNTKGAHSQKRKPSWEQVDEKPLKKRKQRKEN